MKPDDAMRLLTLLRGRGFTIEISGEGECWLTASSETSIVVSAPTTEEALQKAGQHLLAHLSETVTWLQQYVTAAKPE